MEAPPAHWVRKHSFCSRTGRTSSSLLQRSWSAFRLSFYYAGANLFLNEVGLTNAAGKMTLGQVSEGIVHPCHPFPVQ